jgi:4'-phosphopantetheinyl transferase
MPEGPRTLTTFCQGPSPATVLQAPASFQAPKDGEAHVWYATLESLRPRVQEFTDLLDPVEQERALKFRFDHDRERFILGHGLLRSLLGRYLKRDGSLIRMARGPFGKPYLERKDLRFNMSDTKDAVLVAFTHKLEIGADIETMTRRVDHVSVASHYFTAPELRSIQDAAGDPVSKPQEKRRFLELWTRKEAVLKASGVGIMDDLKALRVDGERNTMLITHEAFSKMAAPEYHVITHSIGDDHVISLASPVAIGRISIWN